MTSYKRVTEANEKLVEKLAKFSGLENWLVHNIMQYCRQIQKNKEGEVDYLIFMAEISAHFNINSVAMIERMYAVLKKAKSKFMTVEDYAKGICLFLCNRREIKVDYVFQVYDINGDGVIDIADMNILLRHCVPSSTDSTDESDSAYSLRELVELVIKMAEVQTTGGFDQITFRKLIKQDKLNTEILGRCLPSEKSVESHNEKKRKETNRARCDICVKKLFQRKISFEREQGARFITKLEDSSGLDQSLIENITQFAKQLFRCDGEIDSVTFMSQMAKQFEIYSLPLLTSMYECMKKTKSPGISLEDFCTCVCTFLSPNEHLRVELVFKVYDMNNDGAINRCEIQTYLKTYMMNKEGAEPDVQHDKIEESVRDMVEVVFKLLDVKPTENIYLEDFRRVVKENSIFLQLLGRCLPTEGSLQKKVRHPLHCHTSIDFIHARNTLRLSLVSTKLEHLQFRKRLTNKTPYYGRDKFKIDKTDLLDGLKTIELKKKKKGFQLYPVTLDLP